MHILLVNPKPIEPFTVYGPSLGLCYLSSYLKKGGISDIEGIDLNIDSISDLESAITHSDIVGVYCSTKALRPAFEVAKMAKLHGKIVVFGGPHPSVLPMEVMQNPDVDYAILSEGEESFHALVNALETSGDYSSIDGFAYKIDGEIKVNPRTSFINNLDTIPFPDRDLFRFDYSKIITFCATRGCPYKCANCQPALSLQTCAFRMRTVDNVLAELRQVAQGKYVLFIDNDLTVNKRWLKQLCEGIIAEKIKIKWDCQGRVNTLSAGLMRLMKKSGCRNIGVGVESGSQHLLDNFLNKQLDLQKVEKVLEEATAEMVNLHGWFIIGIPTETKNDIENTIEYSLSHNFASIGFSIGTPWPGTVFYKVASENNWLLTNNWEEYNEKQYSKLRTPDWGPDDISYFRNEIIRRFRDKGWIVNEADFIFTNPYYGKGIVKRSIAKLRMMFFRRDRLVAE